MPCLFVLPTCWVRVQPFVPIRCVRLCMRARARACMRACVRAAAVSVCPLEHPSACLLVHPSVGGWNLRSACPRARPPARWEWHRHRLRERHLTAATAGPAAELRRRTERAVGALSRCSRRGGLCCGGWLNTCLRACLRACLSAGSNAFASARMHACKHARALASAHAHRSSVWGPMRLWVEKPYRACDMTMHHTHAGSPCCMRHAMLHTRHCTARQCSAAPQRRNPRRTSHPGGPNMCAGACNGGCRMGQSTQISWADVF